MPLSFIAALGPLLSKDGLRQGTGPASSHEYGRFRRDPCFGERPWRLPIAFSYVSIAARSSYSPQASRSSFTTCNLRTTRNTASSAKQSTILLSGSQSALFAMRLGQPARNADWRLRFPSRLSKVDLFFAAHVFRKRQRQADLQQRSPYTVHMHYLPTALRIRRVALSGCAGGCALDEDHGIRLRAFRALDDVELDLIAFF